MSGSITSKMAKLSSFWAMISKASAAVYAFRTGKPSFFQIDFHQIGNFPFIVYNKNSLLHDNNSFYMGFQRENGF